METNEFDETPESETATWLYNLFYGYELSAHDTRDIVHWIAAMLEAEVSLERTKEVVEIWAQRKQRFGDGNEND